MLPERPTPGFMLSAHNDLLTKRGPACQGNSPPERISDSSQQFIRTHNETLSVVAMCVSDENVLSL